MPCRARCFLVAPMHERGREVRPRPKNTNMSLVRPPRTSFKTQYDELWT